MNKANKGVVIKEVDPKEICPDYDGKILIPEIDNFDISDLMFGNDDIPVIDDGDQLVYIEEDFADPSKRKGGEPSMTANREFRYRMYAYHPDLNGSKLIDGVYDELIFQSNDFNELISKYVSLSPKFEECINRAYAIDDYEFDVNSKETDFFIENYQNYLYERNRQHAWACYGALGKCLLNGISKNTCLDIIDEYAPHAVFKGREYGDWIYESLCKDKHEFRVVDEIAKELVNHNISESRFDKVFSDLAAKHGLTDNTDKKAVVALAKFISNSKFFKDRKKKLQSGMEL